MPIDWETFETASERELVERAVPDRALGRTDLSPTERVAGFLLANDGHAFRPHEIAVAVGLSDDIVAAALSRLREQRVVEQKSAYWAAVDRRDGDGRYEHASRVFGSPAASSPDHGEPLDGPSPSAEGER